MGGGGGQESVNQKFTLHFDSYTARIKVIQTHTKKEFVVQRTEETHSLHYSLQCNP